MNLACMEPFLQLSALLTCTFAKDILNMLNMTKIITAIHDLSFCVATIIGRYNYSELRFC